MITKEHVTLESLESHNGMSETDYKSGKHYFYEWYVI